MSVTKIELLGVTGTENKEGPGYVASYRVATDDPEDGPFQVNSSLPFKYGDVYEIGNEIDILCRASEVASTPVAGNRFRWNSSVTFTRPETTEEFESVFDRPYDQEWYFEKREREAERDVDGRPVGNSAGDRFERIPLVDDSRPVLRIVRNERTFDEKLAVQLRDCLNRSQWRGWAKHAVKIGNIVGRQVYDRREGLYWAVTYEFVFQFGTWWERFEDAGLMAWYPDDNGERIIDGKRFSKREITDPDGNVVRVPQPLTIEGYDLHTFNRLANRYNDAIVRRGLEDDYEKAEIKNPRRKRFRMQRDAEFARFGLSQ